MSVDAGAYLTLQGLQHVSTDRLFAAFQKHGWALDDGGEVRYLPLGDDGDYDWRTAGLESRDKVLREILEKSQLGEVLGFTMTWLATGVGGEFLVFPDGQVVMTPSIGRRQIAGGLSDVSWYLDRIAPVFAELPEVVLLSWKWKESFE
jgi:hypothetical protein